MMFAGDSGSSEKKPNGGVDVIKNGTATMIPNGPLFVGGMAWHDGALYLSGGWLVNGAPTWQIARWSGFNGTTFTSQTVLYTAPKGFEGFDGIAFGPNGHLYVGVAAGDLNNNDHGPASTSPFLYDILTMTAMGKNVKVFAKGIRQPWQMAFSPAGALYSSNLNQDSPKKVEKLNPPDFLLKVRKGQNYGFPKCNWTTGSPCKRYAKPFRLLPAHFDPMGIAFLHGKLYLGSFAGMGAKGGGALYQVPLHGHSLKPVVTSFPILTDALAAHDGKLYVGGSGKTGGVVYQVTP
jgi:glucose/arabinose dehydrogenase